MNRCTDLDDYLANDLADNRRREFINHLPGCPVCRDAVRANERLVMLLREAAEAEAAPTGLAARFRRRQRARQRLWIAAVGGTLAAAAIALVWLGGQRFEPRPTPQAPTASAVVTPARVRVTFPNADVLAVREPTAMPGVTFVRVYPDLSRQTRPQPDPRNRQ